MSTRQNPSFCFVLLDNRAPPALHAIGFHQARDCFLSRSVFFHSLPHRMCVSTSTILVSTCVHPPHVALPPEGSITPVPARKHAFSMENLNIISSADCFFPKDQTNTLSLPQPGHANFRARENVRLTTGTFSLQLHSSFLKSEYHAPRPPCSEGDQQQHPQTLLWHRTQNILPERRRSGASLSRTRRAYENHQSHTRLSPRAAFSNITITSRSSSSRSTSSDGNSDKRAGFPSELPSKSA